MTVAETSVHVLVVKSDAVVSAFTGFNYLIDLTYPLATQSIVSDGQHFQFFVYQLNTLRLWIEDELHPLRNICWTTDRLRLYDTIENNEVKGLNVDVLKLLVKFVMMQPSNIEFDTRPYLPDELPPARQRELLINYVGTKWIPFDEKPGQHEYPRGSAYFQQNI